MKLIARAIDGLAGAVISAARILARRSDRMCCSEHAIVVERDGRLYWRRHDWLADEWAPLGTPGAEPAASRRAKRPGSGSKTRLQRRRTRR